ncbi:MAG: hypothetical protein R2795_01460 [Saprospiraceae bacterium]
MKVGISGIWMLLCMIVNAQTVHFFQDSQTGGYYDTGLAFATNPSTLLAAGSTGDKIPVAWDVPPVEGENSLRLRWASHPGGDWSAFIIAPGFPFQNIAVTDTLSFWCYAPNGITAANLPAIAMEGAPGNTRSNAYPLTPYTSDIPAQEWTLVKVPLSIFFDDPNQTNINFNQIKAIILRQHNADAVEHELLIDNVRTYRINASGSAVDTPPT